MDKIKLFSKELDYIKDERLKDNATKLILMLPDYFFKVPASSTGKYHPSFSLCDGGLVRHTKAAVRIANELLCNESIGYNYSAKEKDLIIIALIMHDGFKHGLKEEEYTCFTHPLIVSNFIKDNKAKLSLTEEELELLTSMIESHMGQWNTNAYSKDILPKPKNKCQRFVHMCDYLSSRKFLDIKFDNNEIVD